ncbi:MAG: nickel pincer cofactor biosynthesis protein LarB [Desulfobacterales bacterium]|nr:nickel pincer cofactor biosynthesis protein LarB [Desulfobacterales bacterium]MDJ0854922.1 nickel pincer cofactor biosynthesis protein LarB [Desulfobacterales bacterium]MDJ0888633.1 nickel pincer cofactor biosynthesis protein LarB [Desulfobacterales bacterium]MDJ0988431.1 nickel pincer cofactor biosynthesis protein LarB [Desulfobacterales bacterium]
MDRAHLKAILARVSSGEVPVDEAVERLSHLAYEDIAFAHIDHHRSLRKGFPEVVYGEGKTAEQIIGILERMVEQESIVLVTRVTPDKADRIQAAFPEGVYHADARMVIWGEPVQDDASRKPIMVISAGTSDIPVAREAYLTAQAMGNPVQAAFDVGVAGIHRLLGYHEQMAAAGVLVVVAGMEGALPSVVAGMVDRPVIAVPTSVGYGSHLGGLTALFGMLNSCSSNVAVVNIDNGFGAGYMAAVINRP